MTEQVELPQITNSFFFAKQTHYIHQWTNAPSMSNWFSSLLQAPSSSLCTSIIALHGDSKTCAELLLDLCNKLSQKLGMSEEIDNNLLIRYVMVCFSMEIMAWMFHKQWTICILYLNCYKRTIVLTRWIKKAYRYCRVGMKKSWTVKDWVITLLYVVTIYLRSSPHIYNGPGFFHPYCLAHPEG